MKYLCLLLTALLLTACTTQPAQPAETESTTKTFIETTSCNVDSDCTTPPGFLILSNCPFTSLCLEGQCAVVCPMIFPATDTTTCKIDSDCDCSSRGAGTLDCVCSDGACYSIER